MKTYTKYIILIFTINFSFSSLHGTDPQSIFDAIGFSEMVSVNIDVDWEALTADVRKEGKQEAVFSYKNEFGNTQYWNIGIKLRGKFRRTHCQTPPMKLFFKKEDLKLAGLAPYDDMKLVNYCVENPVEAKKLLIKEYMAYKMYNALAPESFRVQMLKITFRDTKSWRKIRQWAFLIEDTAQMLARVNAKKVKNKKVENILAFDDKSSMRVALFQYMIGNADWQLYAQKNVKWIQKNNKIIPVPYDFDFSGLVNPSYGIPNPDYQHKTMQERVFLGDTLVLSEADIRFFLVRKAHLLNLVKDNNFVRKDLEKEILGYLDTFFQGLCKGKVIAAAPHAKPMTVTAAMASSKVKNTQQ